MNAGFRLLQKALPFLLVAVVLVLWEIAARSGLWSRLLFPSLASIAYEFALFLVTPERLHEAWVSLYRALGGFALAATVGILLGIVMGRSRFVAALLDPLFSGTYAVPKIVMLPIFMLWFGIGELSKVLIIALACFYPVFINAYYGAKATPTILVWSALNMGAGRGAVFRRVVVPSAAPMILAGMRVSLALSFIVMFAAEMINASSGLGHLIRVAENSLRFDLMYVSLLSIAILGYAGDRLVRLAHSRLLAWQQPA